MGTFQNVVSTTTVKADKAREAGFASFIDNKTPVAGIVSGIADLNGMTVEQRLGLLRGPKVSVMMAGKVIRDVPVRAFMAMSKKANDYFRNMPQRKHVVLPAGCATKHALDHVLKSTTTQEAIGGGETVRIPGGRSFLENVQIHAAGIALGMPHHVQHVTNFLRMTVSRELISYEDLTAMVTSLGTSDPLFQHLANDLARRRFQRAIGTTEDEADFANYLAQHENLDEAMSAIDTKHENARREYAERMAAQAKVRQEKQEKDAKVAHEAHVQYKARVQALTSKLNKAMGNVLTLTQEEAELRRELGI